MKFLHIFLLASWTIIGFLVGYLVAAARYRTIKPIVKLSTMKKLNQHTELYEVDPYKEAIGD